MLDIRKGAELGGERNAGWSADCYIAGSCAQTYFILDQLSTDSLELKLLHSIRIPEPAFRPSAMFGLFGTRLWGSEHRTRASSANAKQIANRRTVDCMDAGLRGSAGAQEIINMITSRPLVTKLILGHNQLGNEGCAVLFNFLRSVAGRRYRITELSLNSNGIGDRGLMAIALYLTDNTNLTELYLQNNQFTCNPSTILSFTRALNTSRLRLLSLTTNRSLSDTFAEVFFSELDSPYLGELHLSAVGITRRSAPCIAKFVSSPRCRLHTFKCNGNALGFRGVRNIIRAVEISNFTLLRVELHSNELAVDPNGAGSDNTEDEESEDDERSIGPEAWKSCEVLIKGILARNAHLKKEVEKEALEVLVYSRVILLRGSNEDVNDSVSAGSHFTALPTELRLQILSFLAPTLSAAQRLRIFIYGSSSSTLPSLLPSLRSTCTPDPSVVDVGPANVWSINNGCSSGQCMGASSFFCQREQARVQWLETVACTAYDPGLTEGF
ncbi:hypothetical protein D9758_002916 [Tetrapyrgos nigripes]|uniref:RNI-like protein n=1 Tax=Tetrapyrgos nigripes TaxID=182062 RepID=A0A8H5GPP8_9AGAR|nr:hypothetical protein D9758_002916 [Tetrapyrgos nigripes]